MALSTEADKNTNAASCEPGSDSTRRYTRSNSQVLPSGRTGRSTVTYPTTASATPQKTSRKPQVCDADHGEPHEEEESLSDSSYNDDREMSASLDRLYKKDRKKRKFPHIQRYRVDETVAESLLPLARQAWSVIVTRKPEPGLPNTSIRVQKLKRLRAAIPQLILKGDLDESGLTTLDKLTLTWLGLDTVENLGGAAAAPTGTIRHHPTKTLDDGTGDSRIPPSSLFPSQSKIIAMRDPRSLKKNFVDRKTGARVAGPTKARLARTRGMAPAPSATLSHEAHSLGTQRRVIPGWLLEGENSRNEVAKLAAEAKEEPLTSSTSQRRPRLPYEGKEIMALVHHFDNAGGKRIKDIRALLWHDQLEPDEAKRAFKAERTPASLMDLVKRLQKQHTSCASTVPLRDLYIQKAERAEAITTSLTTKGLQSTSPEEEEAELLQEAKKEEVSDFSEDGYEEDNEDGTDKEEEEEEEERQASREEIESTRT